MKSGKRTPKVDAWKLVKCGELGLSGKKNILTTNHNAVRGVIRPLNKRFRTRKVMFWRRRFCSMIYKDNMTSGVRSASVNKVAQVYVVDFGDVIIYPMAHMKDAHIYLCFYFVDTGVPEHLHSENDWGIPKSKKWKKILDEEVGIKLLQTEIHSPFQNNAEREIQQS